MVIIRFQFFGGKMTIASSILIVLTAAIAIYFTHAIRGDVEIAIYFRRMPQTENDGAWMATKFLVYLITIFNL